MPTRFSLRHSALTVLSAALLFAQVFHPSSAVAQSESAAMSGRVTDQSGAVVPGVEVEIKNTDTNVSRMTTTNRDGYYSMPSLRPGHYVMTVRKQSFRSVSVTGITLNVQDNLSRNFALQVGSFSESITVQAEGVNVNTTDAAVSTVIDRKFVANMPLNGRSFQDLLTLAPGVAVVGNAGTGSFGNTGPGRGGEITVNGQRTESNYFTVDGVGANVGTQGGDFGYGAGFAGATPSETALGTTQSMVSVDALQEFRATTSTYSAEYGRTPGGQFSLTTRSGTNDWHGSLYDYFRNEALDANDWFLNQINAPRSKERQNDFGGTLGGPLTIPGVYDGKDRTFFFVSYEGLRLWKPAGIQRVAVPDDSLRANAPATLQPVLNAFPRVNAGEGQPGDQLGIYQAAVSNPATIDSFSLRIDHKLSEKLSIFGRFANTPSSSRFTDYATPTTNISNNRLLTAGITARINSRQINEFRFNVTRSNAEVSSTFPDQGEAPFDIASLPGPDGKPFPSTGGYFTLCLCYGDFAIAAQRKAANTQVQYDVADTHSWSAGQHLLQFGFDWRRLSTYARPFIIQEEADFFGDESVLDGITDFAFGYSYASEPVKPIYKNVSLFAQDDWKLSSRLSLSFGLRWDVNPAPTNAQGPSPYTLDQITDLSTAQLAPAGTPLWQTDWRAFAPRLGFAYSVSRAPGRETVIRGGWGKFYDMGNARGSTGFGGIGLGRYAEFESTSFPLTSAQLMLPPPNLAPPYDTPIYAFDPKMTLPSTMQWNVAVQQALGRDNSLTVSYVGSAGRKLLTTFEYSPEELGNPNFSADICAGCLYVTKNGATSDYHALQAAFQRRLAHGLQVLASYTWSHSTDDATSNFLLSTLEHGSSDFDIRHNFQVAATYEVPGRYSNRVLGSLLENWGLDTRLSARSALPVDILGSQAVDPHTRATLYYHPNLVPGQPLVLYGSQYPGGKLLNYDAYEVAPDGVEGDVGRNSARGFGAWQINLGLRREFPIYERLHMQFRAEAFNLFNHPNFGFPVNYLGNGQCGPFLPGQSNYCFGVATNSLNRSIGGLSSLYQVGGPRSLQLALKFQF